jgi:hypothetical protein
VQQFIWRRFNSIDIDIDIECRRGSSIASWLTVLDVSNRYEKVLIYTVFPDIERVLTALSEISMSGSSDERPSFMNGLSWCSYKNGLSWESP